MIVPRYISPVIISPLKSPLWKPCENSTARMLIRLGFIISNVPGSFHRIILSRLSLYTTVNRNRVYTQLLCFIVYPLSSRCHLSVSQ